MSRTIYFGFGLIGVLLFFIRVGGGLETSVPHQDCGSPFIRVRNFEVIPCEKKSCILKRGENATLIGDFVTLKNSERLKIDVYQQDINYPVFETIVWSKLDVCGKWEVKCPAVAEELQHVLFEIEVPKAVPAMKFRLKLVVYGDNNKQFLCKSVPLEIQ